MATLENPMNEHSIPLSQAIEMTKRYREHRPKILSDEFRGKDILPLSETFNKDAFLTFFKNDKVKAIRIYYGMKEDLQVHAILVGVDEQGADMLPSGAMELTEDLVTENEILEESQRCPPNCPEESPLNTP